MGGGAWVAIVVALIALIGVVVNNLVIARNNRRLEARWKADQASAEKRWRTELDALEQRTRTAAEDDERKDKRAKAIDIYKWASELAVSTDPHIAQAGVDALKGLLMGELLDDDMKVLVAATLSSSYAIEGSTIERALEAGEDVEVVQMNLEETDPDVASQEQTLPDNEEDDENFGEGVVP